MADERVDVVVLGAGYSGLTTAAELALRGQRVRIVAQSLGSAPPMTIVGTQSRRFPGMSASTENFSQDDLLARELATINRFLPLAADPSRTGVMVIPGLKASRRSGVWWNVRELPAALKARATETERAMQLVCSPPRAGNAAVAALRAAGYASVDEAPVLMIESDKYFRFLLSIVKAHGGMLCLGCKVRGAAGMAQAAAALPGGHAAAVVNCMGVAAPAAGGAGGTYSNTRGEVLMFESCPARLPFYVIDDDRQSSLAQLPGGQLYMCGEPCPRRVPGGWDAQCTRDTLAGAADLCAALLPAGAAPTLADVSESWALDRPTRAEGFNVGIRGGGGGASRVPLLLDNSGHAGAGVAASWACAACVADALAANGALGPAQSASAAARQRQIQSQARL
eukprot:g5707.t1